MNSQVMMTLAVLLLVGAGVAGYWGLSMSREPQPVVLAEPQRQEAPSVRQRIEQVVSEPRHQVVTLARDVPAQTNLKADDLVVESLRIAPPGSFADPQLLVGRQLWRDLPGGAVLDEYSFAVGSPLARMIREGERALAVSIDEVVAVGGYLKPGDYVDVLLFLREDERNGDRSVQVAVPALRVLTVGAEVGLDLAGRPAQLARADDDDKQNNARRDVPRTAVLAVPEQLLTRFALAAQVGTLRLAVRSAEEGRLANFYAGDPVRTEKIAQQLYQFERFALRRVERTPSGIPVFRGSTVSRDSP